jgi:hypothetical protein
MRVFHWVRKGRWAKKTNEKCLKIKHSRTLYPGDHKGAHFKHEEMMTGIGNVIRQFGDPQ